MQQETRVTQIFRRLDVDAMLDLVLIVGAAALLIIILQRFVPWIANRLHGSKRLHVLATVPLIRLLIILTAIGLIIPRIIEPSLQNMVALLGAVGLALGFALKDYASSLLAGIVAIGEKPYRNGDWIRVGDDYGEVTHVGMRTVELVTANDDKIYIPHSRLWADSIANSNHGTPRLQCAADFYLHPNHDAGAARQVLRDVALTSPYLYFDGDIDVNIRERPWGTHYRLKAYPVDAAQQFRFVSDLTVRGKAALLRLGVTFTVAPAAVDPPG